MTTKNGCQALLLKRSEPVPTQGIDDMELNRRVELFYGVHSLSSISSGERTRRSSLLSSAADTVIA